MEKGYCVKIFAATAIYLDIVPEGLLDFISDKFGEDNKSIKSIKKKGDLEGVIKTSTVYLMQDIEDGCQAKCAFCVQSSASTSEKRKSTLVDNSLIKYPLKVFTDKIKGGILADHGVRRVCIQTIYNEETFTNLLNVTSSLKSVTDVPITACCIPIDKQSLIDLKNAGLNMIVINYETATKELFHDIRGEGVGGPYRWEKVTESIDEALEVFGKGRVGSHLQLGLGETAKEALTHIQNLKDKGVFVSLFSFRPLEGTKLENMQRISYRNFHKIQLGSYLIQLKSKRSESFEFDESGQIVNYGVSDDELAALIETGTPFQNRGCPGCNRLYYEVTPDERFYSFPRPLTGEETARIKAEIMS